MARKSRKNTGLIGLGIIGSRVAAILRTRGFQVYVWNRTPRSEPNFLSSPAEVAEVSDIIQLFVADAHALFEVIDAFANKLTPNHTVICSATVGPEATVEAAQLVQGYGAKFLDAPFTGSKLAAEKGELVYYIGGGDETLRGVEPVLKASSKAIIKIGEIGHAATVKIATNIISAVTTQTLAEALAIVERSGIAPSSFIAAMEQNANRSALTDMKLPKMVRGEFDPHFSLKHMFKDVQLAIHIANSLSIDVPATTATAGVMYGGLNRGWADLDFSALAKIYQDDPDQMDDMLTHEQPLALKDATEPSARKEPDHNGTPAKETLSHMVAPPRSEDKAPKSATSEIKPHEKSEPLSPEKESLGATLKSEGIAPVSLNKTETNSAPENSHGENKTVENKSDGTTPAHDAKPAESKPNSKPPLNRIRRWFNVRNAN